MESTKLRSELRNQLTRFLHLGREEPKYYPGCWSSHDYYDVSKLKAIDYALANGSNNTEVVDIILKAYKQGWCTRFETIAFALTKCLLHGSPAVKEATYKAASEICVSAEQLMIFNNFTWVLKTGNGRGWCKHVREWYLKKEPMELAKELTRVKSRHGRSHKTLLRKSHVKIAENDHARGAVIKYGLFGLKRAKQLVDNAEGTKEIFDYIQKVEDFRRCEDPVAAAAIVRKNSFTLDHVPGHLLTSQEVWNAVLPQLSLEDVLLNIQRIHNMGFLAADSTTTAIIVSMLSDKNVIKKSQVTPLAVYITMVNYQKKSKPLKSQKAKVAIDKATRRRLRQEFDNETGEWLWTVTRRHPKEVKTWGIEKQPNQLVIDAMQKLIDHTWLLTPPTNVRYLITLDMRHHMFKGRHFCKNFTVPKKGKKTVTKTSPGGGGDADTVKVGSKKRLSAECFFNRNITPGHAAIILALQLLKREKNVNLAVFTDAGIELVKIDPNFSTISETEFVLRKSNLGKVQLDAPIEWARNNNRKFDVFINMVDRTTRYMELDLKERGGRGPGGKYAPPPPAGSELVDHCPARALQRYRAQYVHDAKLIVMSLASLRVMTTDGSHNGILDIVGIDEHVPKVMDAFALGQFE
ncbi:PREDICTED: 60 kDa SS-A/Ro ribonucleoprotein-like [Papilio xuthus]|uniref:60 kDa SS-A/Ro ribonucleoprotein-like n=1 Tax=Papilio xuthus TaxID=66420 RepID=A0AAJ6Z7V6_PAPXU|nr:PREDICTED: 60 kDa SS-A/Ro ribonucleoprotein-like [Papilio xuthus]